MRYSQYFLKTLKEVPANASLASHKLLLKAGYIAESVAGRYYFLPIGWRVHEKIKQIIKTEMDNAGAQEMMAPTLHPLELWEETNRTDTAGFELMNVTDRRGGKFALGGTAEEMFVDLVRKFPISYKDLPFNIYQFSNKFRDEMRARGGLLRVREFVMKDAYSFHTDAEDFQLEYNKMADAYTRIFAKMDLKAEKVLADNGYIGGEYCHEYQVECEAGEGRYFVSEDGEYIAHEDVAQFELEHMNPEEEVLDFETAELPAEICNMEQLQEHYNMPKWRFLKNVVFKNRVTDEIIIATIRGDLEVNKTKLEKHLDAVGQLESATDYDLKSIGTKPGFVHSWGLKAKYVGDLSLKTVNNFYGGQKTETTDPKNVNYGRDFEADMLVDIATAYDGAPTKEHGKLIEKTGVEVGNIFQLGTHYSDKMKGANFTDKDGKPKPFYMGCYGIGLGRTMATVVEKFHDEKGIKWPKSIAPFTVYLSVIGKKDDAYQKAEAIYEELKRLGVEVFYDDRREKKVGPGQKFADFELLGFPYQLVISERLLDEDSMELWNREKGTKEIMKIDQLSTDLFK